jgi:hypothetical protein
MNEKGKYLLLLVLVSGVVNWGLNAISSAEDRPKIKYEKGMLSVQADSVKPQTLFFELGKQCNIEVIARGNVFPDQGISVNFHELPIKDGVRAMVKASTLPNCLMDFQEDKDGEMRLARVVLILEGTGEIVLNPAPPATSQQPQKPEGGAINPNIAAMANSSKNLMANKSFAEGHNFHWDGSALIDFPEYKGQLPFEKGNYPWQDDAKLFAQKTMSLMPPSVREGVKDILIKSCDEIAKERGAKTITPEITAAALEEVARAFHMPSGVMNNLPKTLDDLNKPRIPLERNNLKEEYR